MLIEQTFYELMKYALQQSATLNKNRLEIEKFEELCAILRCQGSEFTLDLDVTDSEVGFHLMPANHGDYLDIVEALCGMGAHRQKASDHCEIINPQPDAPIFWLHIPVAN